MTLLTQKAASSLARMDQVEGPAHVHIRVRKQEYNHFSVKNVNLRVEVREPDLSPTFHNTSLESLQ